MDDECFLQLLFQCAYHSGLYHRNTRAIVHHIRRYNWGGGDLYCHYLVAWGADAGNVDMVLGKEKYVCTILCFKQVYV